MLTYIISEMKKKRIKWKNDYVILKDTGLWEFKHFTLNEFAGFEEYASDLLSDNQLIF